ncbi:MAG: XRE family transcriptional regulator [Verrucomicrobiaceae bacterium]|nr:MAG: XRE family transcriptional regulator [Verrucomicrobiaceae bacterium]
MRLRDIFAKNLWRARTAAGLSQDELAGRVGMDRGYVSKLENAKYSVSIDMIENLATALDTPPHNLLKPD